MENYIYILFTIFFISSLFIKFLNINNYKKFILFQWLPSGFVFIISIILFFNLGDEVFNMFALKNLDFSVSLLIDPLSTSMMIIFCAINFMFNTNYFFLYKSNSIKPSFFNIITVSMIILSIISNNFMLYFFIWELISLFYYLYLKANGVSSHYSNKFLLLERTFSLLLFIGLIGISYSLNTESFSNISFGLIVRNSLSNKLILLSLFLLLLAFMMRIIHLTFFLLKPPPLFKLLPFDYFLVISINTICPAILFLRLSYILDNCSQYIYLFVYVIILFKILISIVINFYKRIKELYCVVFLLGYSMFFLLLFSKIFLLSFYFLISFYISMILLLISLLPNIESTPNKKMNNYAGNIYLIGVIVSSASLIGMPFTSGYFAITDLLWSLLLHSDVNLLVFGVCLVSLSIMGYNLLKNITLQVSLKKFISKTNSSFNIVIAIMIIFNIFFSFFGIPSIFVLKYDHILQNFIAKSIAGSVLERKYMQYHNIISFLYPFFVTIFIFLFYKYSKNIKIGALQSSTKDFLINGHNLIVNGFLNKILYSFLSKIIYNTYDFIFYLIYALKRMFLFISLLFINTIPKSVNSNLLYILAGLLLFIIVVLGSK